MFWGLFLINQSIKQSFNPARADKTVKVFVLFSAARFYARKELALTLVSALYSSSDVKALVNKFREWGGGGGVSGEGCV